jgi:hypothetical protein
MHQPASMLMLCGAGSVQCSVLREVPTARSSLQPLVRGGGERAREADVCDWRERGGEKVNAGTDGTFRTLESRRPSACRSLFRRLSLTRRPKVRIHATAGTTAVRLLPVRSQRTQPTGPTSGARAARDDMREDWGLPILRRRGGCGRACAWRFCERTGVPKAEPQRRVVERREHERKP